MNFPLVHLGKMDDTESTKDTTSGVESAAEKARQAKQRGKEGTDGSAGKAVARGVVTPREKKKKKKQRKRKHAGAASDEDQPLDVTGLDAAQQAQLQKALKAIRKGTPGGMKIKHGGETQMQAAPQVASSPSDGEMEVEEEQATASPSERTTNTSSHGASASKATGGKGEATAPPTVIPCQSAAGVQKAAYDRFLKLDSNRQFSTMDVKKDLAEGNRGCTPWFQSRFDPDWIPREAKLSSQTQRDRFRRRWAAVQPFVAERGHVGYPVLKRSVKVDVKDLPFEEFTPQNVEALFQAYTEADFQCPVKGCEGHEQNVVTPVARCQGHTTPRSEAGEFLGIGLQPGLGVREPFTVQVDPERIMSHWQAWHLRKGLCIVLPCLAFEVSCHPDGKKSHEHIFWGRKAAVEHLEKCHEGYLAKEGSAYLDEDKPAQVVKVSTAVVGEALKIWGKGKRSYYAENYSEGTAKRLFRGTFRPVRKWDWAQLTELAQKIATETRPDVTQFWAKNIRAEEFEEAEKIAMRAWDVSPSQQQCPFVRVDNNQPVYWRFKAAVVNSFRRADEVRVVKTLPASTAAPVVATPAKPTVGKGKGDKGKTKSSTQAAPSATVTKESDTEEETSKSWAEQKMEEEKEEFEKTLNKSRKTRSSRKRSRSRSDRKRRSDASISAGSEEESHKITDGAKRGKPNVDWSELPQPVTSYKTLNMSSATGARDLMKITRYAYHVKLYDGELVEKIRTIELAAAIQLLWRSCPNTIREEAWGYIHPQLNKREQTDLMRKSVRHYVPLKVASVTKYLFRRDPKVKTYPMRNSPKEVDTEEMSKLKAATRMNIYHRVLWVIKLIVSEIGNKQLVRAECAGELSRGREVVPEDALMNEARDRVLPGTDSVIEVSSEDTKMAMAPDMEITIKQNAETPEDVKAIVESVDLHKIHVPGHVARKSKSVETTGTMVEMPGLEDEPPTMLENVETKEKRSLSSFHRGAPSPVSKGSQPVEQTGRSSGVTGGDRTTETQATGKPSEATPATGASKTSDNRNEAPTTGQQAAVLPNVGVEAPSTMSAHGQVSSTAESMTQLVNELRQAVQSSNKPDLVMQGLVSGYSQLTQSYDQLGKEWQFLGKQNEALDSRLKRTLTELEQSRAKLVEATAKAENHERHSAFLRRQLEEAHKKLSEVQSKDRAKLKELTKEVAAKIPKDKPSVSAVVQNQVGSDVLMAQKIATAVRSYQIEIRELKERAQKAEAQAEESEAKYQDNKKAPVVHEGVVVHASVEPGQIEMCWTPSIAPLTYSPQGDLEVEDNARFQVATRCRQLAQQFVLESKEPKGGGSARLDSQDANATINMLRRWAHELLSLTAYVLEMSHARWGTSVTPMSVHELRNRPLFTRARLQTVRKGKVVTRLLARKSSVTANVSERGAATEVLVVPDEQGDIHESVNAALAQLGQQIENVTQLTTINHTAMLHCVNERVREVLQTLLTQPVQPAPNCEPKGDTNNNQTVQIVNQSQTIHVGPLLATNPSGSSGALVSTTANSTSTKLAGHGKVEGGAGISGASVCGVNRGTAGASGASDDVAQANSTTATSMVPMLAVTDGSTEAKETEESKSEGDLQLVEVSPTQQVPSGDHPDGGPPPQSQSAADEEEHWRQKRQKWYDQIALAGRYNRELEDLPPEVAELLLHFDCIWTGTDDKKQDEVVTERVTKTLFHIEEYSRQSREAEQRDDTLTAADFSTRRIKLENDLWDSHQNELEDREQAALLLEGPDLPMNLDRFRENQPVADLTPDPMETDAMEAGAIVVIVPDGTGETNESRPVETSTPSQETDGLSQTLMLQQASSVDPEGEGTTTAPEEGEGALGNPLVIDTEAPGLSTEQETQRAERSIEDEQEESSSGTESSYSGSGVDDGSLSYDSEMDNP